MQQVELRTERLWLRPLRDDDAPAFAAMNGDPAVMRYYPATLSRAESDALLGRIRAGVEERGFGLWAVELLAEPGFIGMIGITPASIETPFTPCVEAVWRLVPARWGRGYAPEGARAALRFGFDELALPEILAWTATSNEPSQRVMQKLGMVRDPLDFDHPRVAEGHPLRRHVLYRIAR